MSRVSGNRYWTKVQFFWTMFKTIRTIFDMQVTFDGTPEQVLREMKEWIARLGMEFCEEPDPRDELERIRSKIPSIRDEMVPVGVPKNPPSLKIDQQEAIVPEVMVIPG